MHEPEPVGYRKDERRQWLEPDQLEAEVFPCERSWERTINIGQAETNLPAMTSQSPVLRSSHSSGYSKSGAGAQDVCLLTAGRPLWALAILTRFASNPYMGIRSQG